MNQVQVNEAEALASIEAIGVDEEAERAAAHEAQRQGLAEAKQKNLESWNPASAMAVDFIASVVCPAWDLSQDEKGRLSDNLAAVLEHYFPGGFDGFDDWHPAAQFAFTAASIAVMRIDFSTYRFKALRHDDSETEGRQANSGDRAEPERQNGQRYTTGGE